MVGPKGEAGGRGQVGFNHRPHTCLSVLFTPLLPSHCPRIAAHLTDILPKVWVEPVNGIIPGNGYHIR